MSERISTFYFFLLGEDVFEKICKLYLQYQTVVLFFLFFPPKSVDFILTLTSGK